MKIGLIDVDGHNYPNLALMKLSAWHKEKGHNVEMFNAFDNYDKVYLSKVFTFTEDYTTVINSTKIIKGGTGYNLTTTLPAEIERAYPDYSLYNIENTAYGYLTRGCPRNCGFCIVTKKEGSKAVKVSDLSGFWKGQKNIELLDPNITASSDCEELFHQLVNSGSSVNFSQGLDARLLTDKKIELLARMKIKHIHFALDHYKDKDIIISNLRKLKEKTGWYRTRISVYILTNYNTTIDQDLERIREVKKLGFNPYVMIYNKDQAPRQIRQLQRYVNNKIIFWSKGCPSFDDYMRQEATNEPGN